MQGNPGLVAPIGAGIFGQKINSGPGYRVYCLRHGDVLVLLLCVGEESTQRKDIDTAHKLADRWRRTFEEGDET